MDVKKIGAYHERADARGVFMGVLNRGTWQEVNYVQTHAGAVRGNHYHKHLREVVFLLKGAAEVAFIDVHDPDNRATFMLRAGEGVEVQPYVLHTMRYLEDTEQISLLDQPFDPKNPDLHTPDAA